MLTGSNSLFTDNFLFVKTLLWCLGEMFNLIWVAGYVFKKYAAQVYWMTDSLGNVLMGLAGVCISMLDSCLLETTACTVLSLIEEHTLIEAHPLFYGAWNSDSESF